MKSEIAAWKFRCSSARFSCFKCSINLPRKIQFQNRNFYAINRRRFYAMNVIEGTRNAMRNEPKYSNEIHRTRRWSWIAFYRMAAGKGQMLVVNGLCGSQSGTRHDPPLGCLKFVYETKDRRISPEIREREIVRMKKKNAQYFTRDSSIARSWNYLIEIIVHDSFFER